MTTLSENKVFLLEHLSLDRIKAFAERLGGPITDRRLGVPGIAKALARKRSLALVTIAEAMEASELRAACSQLAMPGDGNANELRAWLVAALETEGARAIRKRANAEAATIVTIPATLERVIDGDTIVATAEGTSHYVRFRGVDAPETSESDKGEKDLDYGQMSREEMTTLGEASKRWLTQRLSGRALFLHVQPTPAGPKKYLHHNQHRLLAYVTLDAPDGEEIGHAMLREGQALVWPRNAVTRRYLHPKSLPYVEACSGALERRPGLWEEGMGSLCPRSKEPGEWTIERCKDACFRSDWREVEG